MMKFLKRRGMIVVFAIVVGALSALPTFIAPIVIGEDYKGMQFLYLDDEDIYRARINEVLEGRLGAASPYLYEYKDSQVAAPPLNEYPYALLALVFGLSGAIAVMKFILPGCLFLLVYLLTERLIGDGERDELQWAAVAAGLLVTLGFDFVDHRTTLDIFLHGNDRLHLMVWTRTVNPIVGALALFGFLLLLWDLWEEGRPQRIAFASLFLAYSLAYIFSFAIALAALLLVTTFALLVKRKDAVKRFLAVLLLSSAIEIPYWYNALSVVSGSEGKTNALRNGMFFTHDPIVNKFLLAASLFAAVSLLFAVRRGILSLFDKRAIYMVAFLGAGWLAFCQQIVTGREIWPDHFVQYTIPMGYIIIVALTAIVWRRIFSRIYCPMIAVFCVAPLLWGTMSVASVEHKLPEFRSSQRYAVLVDWLNANSKSDCSVLIREYDEPLERLIPGYTHCDTYSTTYAFSGIPRERVLHNLLLRMRLLSIAPEDARNYMFSEESQVRGYFFDDWNQMFGNGHDPWFLSLVDRLDAEYAEFAKGDLKAQVLAYRMDYLVSESSIPPSVLHELPGLSLVASLPGFAIYAFEPE